MLSQVDALSLYAEPTQRVPLDEVDSAAIRQRVHSRRHYAAFKRLVDILVVVAALPAFLPLMLLAALAILVSCGRPIFFVQDRVGLSGRAFRMIKFRTMHLHAPVETHATQRADPRITPIGGFLRQSHIDELPQLWNVIAGHMTLIGPRPERPELVNRYDQAIPNYGLRHLVKPGLSGWSQVFFGYAADIAETKHKTEYDLYYLSNYGIGVDIIIFFQTLRVYLRPEFVR